MDLREDLERDWNESALGLLAPSWDSQPRARRSVGADMPVVISLIAVMSSPALASAECHERFGRRLVAHRALRPFERRDLELGPRLAASHRSLQQTVLRNHFE